MRARDEKEVVIAIFVGTLPKINQGGQPIAYYTFMHSVLYNLFILCSVQPLTPLYCSITMQVFKDLVVVLLAVGTLTRIFHL